MAEDQEKKQEEAVEVSGPTGTETTAEGTVEVPAEENQVSAFPDASVKGESDLAQARAAVSKVAIAEEQLKELMGAWIDDSGDPSSLDNPVDPGNAGETVVQDVQQPVAQATGDQTSYYPAQAPVGQQQPSQAAPVGQPVPGQVAPAGQACQQNYWRGFQPVQPVQSVQSVQPAPYTQPQPAQPMQPAQPVQPMQSAQPVQPVPPSQPYQQVYAAPQVGQQAAYRAQAGQSVQAQPGQPQPQPVQPQPGQPVQPTQPAQPYAQPTQPQAQPAGYSQTYMPQIQQPAGYVPAQDFTVQPQPVTPAYTKSNRSTLAIVLVVVIALLAIVAAIIMGRILASAGEGGNDIIDQLSPIEQQDSNQNGDANGRGDQNQGGPGSSHGQDQGGDGQGQWGFDWDNDSPNENGIQPGTGQNGVQHIYGGGIDADDGELHDAWNKSVSYSYTEGEYSREGIESIDYYNKTIGYDFDVEYPQLTGDIANLEEINKTIRDTAMAFVIATYENPTSESREMLEAYAVEGYGVPKAVDAILESDVDYAISYNNEDFISICFSDEYSIGSWAGGFVSLRTVNVNLKTGEVYTLDDVLNINDEIAAAFIDNLAKYDGGNAEKTAGRDSFIGALQGKGSEADNVSTTFYIDGNGKVNFGATYRFASSESMARGWWDYTLTDDQLNAAKKDSSMWDCIK